MLKSFQYLLAITCFSMIATALADVTVPMNITDEDGLSKSVGTVIISETKYGLLFTPNLHGLTPGLHGFHIHQNPSCAKNGMAAGGHFDPQVTEKHLGPFNDQGHLGDLPALYIDANGNASLPVLAPRIHDITGISHRALMVHHAGDNYADMPEKLGGGGARMVCGVIN
jgi:Cu-Zn family superoxide dismutase